MPRCGFSHECSLSGRCYSSFWTVPQPTSLAKYWDPGKSAQLGSHHLENAGLAAVWARENTREAIWDTFARREVFATTGTRLRVRVFAGFDFTGRTSTIRTSLLKEKSRPFLIRAIRDVDGANLDRIQVIKGWLDASGAT